VIAVLGPDAETAPLRDAVAAFCADHADSASVGRVGEARFDRTLWSALAGLGVLGVGSDGDTGARELVAVCEALGAAAFPGPLVETFTATHLLPNDAREAVARGEAIATVGVPPLLPFAAEADYFIVLEGEGAWRGIPRGAVTPLATLAGDPWGRVDLECGEGLGESRRARSFGRLAVAALLAAAGQQLLDTAAEHVCTRKQFGKALGDFQAVAHPLAEVAIRVEAAHLLTRLAASRIDAAGEDGAALAAAARISARGAALAAAHQAHQAFGAIGITLEGPAFRVSRRVRQWASLVLAEDGERDAARAVLTAALGGGAA
jgi:alkylation response protein AidB-like acyl-CoA dehydrogenase